MATSNGYGPQNGGSMPQLRPQFRRQGSSFGPGAVHNMAVMVVPNKVDYSVTKGGVRLWAVLFVFIFLCSAMLTVFTDIDDDDDKGIHQSTFDDEDAEPARDLHTPRIVEDDDLDDDEAADNPPDRGPHHHHHHHAHHHHHTQQQQQQQQQHQESPASSPITAADDEDDDDNEGEEEMLFSRLREKAAKHAARRQRKHEAAAQADADAENDADSSAVPQRQKKKRRIVVIQDEPEADKVTSNPMTENGNGNDDDVGVESSKQTRKSRRSKRRQPIVEEDVPERVETPKKVKRSRKAKSVNSDDIEPEAVAQKAVKSAKKQIKSSKKHEIEHDDEDDDDNDENDLNDDTVIDAKSGDADNNDDDDDDDDVDDDDDDVPVPTAQPTKFRAPRGPKKKAASWHKSVAGDDELVPRKNLLKHNKKKAKLDDLDDDDDDDDDEDNENDDENDEDEADEAEERMQSHDIITVRKRSNTYNRKAITNRDDFKHREKLDAADFLLEKHEFDKASKMYEEVLAANSDSPRGHFGKGRCLQLRSEFESNDHLLDAAVAEYQLVLDDDDTPEELFRLTAEKVIECARFRGNLHKVMTVQRALLDRFPENNNLQNDFGVTFLMMGRVEDARNVFSAVLEADSNNALALAYLGYILKVHDGELEKGVLHMRKGLKAADEPLIDAKFYFHLGDGLMRLGRHNEARRVYEEATHLGLFPSAIQRSTHNLDGLIARPWWSLDQTACGKYLRQVERQWFVIREEAVKLLESDSDLWEPEDSHWTDGRREAFYLSRDRELDPKRCTLLPNTCAILQKFIEDAPCFKGIIRFSVLHSGSRIWPHCAPTNYVLDAQLGLVVTSETRLRVGTNTKGWKTGRFIVYDGSFEHEVWFDGAAASAVRLVLAIDLWHPEVPASNRADVMKD